MDAETKDMGIPAYGVAHFYESCEGDRLNRIAERLQTKTPPFFRKRLSFEKARR